MQPTVKVWDPFVRVFHWTLVIGFFTEYFYLEGGHRYFGSYRLHNWLGYFLMGMILLRIVWGFVGTKHARFSDFLRPPHECFVHLVETLRGEDKRYLGHNPAGSAMIIALLMLIIGVCITGWMQTVDAFWGEIWLEELHVLLSNVVVGLVGVHVAANLWVSWRHKENLVLAMITGHKRSERRHATPGHGPHVESEPSRVETDPFAAKSDTVGDD
jgi:cytochrome b